MKKQKILKFWNGRGHGRFGRNHHINVAAYSQVQAAQLVGQACYEMDYSVGTAEIRNYYSPVWGNNMESVKDQVTEPCVYVTAISGPSTPTKIELNK